MAISNIICIILVVTGIVFMLMGSIGILRLPDFYSRSHATSKSDTLGILFVISGLVVYEGFTLSAIKLIFIILFIAFANPIGTHALARSALLRGLKPFFSEDAKKGGKA